MIACNSQQKLKKVFIVGGLGHIGLTLAAVISEYYKVILYDIDENALFKFKQETKASFYEPELNEALIKNKENIATSTHIEECSNCDYIVITIGTPIDEYLNPKLKDFFIVISALSKYLTNQTVILRSTIYPGLTKKIEKKFKKTVKVAFCPERVAGGSMVSELKTLPQIISANNQEAIYSACELFAPLKIKTKILNDTTEGELAKLMTNSYRYIEFAISNQFFMMTQENNCDFYKIYDAMVSDYPRMKNFPKPGYSGSYCLRKDSIQLASWQNGATFSLGYDASFVNESLPLWVFRQMRKKVPDVNKMTVGLLGLAFKGNTDDTRDSLSFRMKKILENEVKKVLVHDPYITIKESCSLNKLLKSSDIVILMTLHDCYKKIKTKKMLIDVWNFFGKGFGI